MNQYEQAFESWLIEHRLRYVPVGQNKRAVLCRNRIKSFDFLVYPEQVLNPLFPDSLPDSYDIPPVIVEVKGRLHKGKSIEPLTNIQCWTTMEDILGLSAWQDAFSNAPVPYYAYFVFAYRFENPFLESQQLISYEYNDEKFCFFAVSLTDYIMHMTVRSKSWQTVTLSAADFRRFCVPAHKLFCGTDTDETNYHPLGRACS